VVYYVINLSKFKDYIENNVILAFIRLEYVSNHSEKVLDTKKAKINICRWRTL